MAKLNTRQWNLYKLLKSNPDKWFTQKEISSLVEGYNYVERNNDKCSAIREDKKAINASEEVDKLIVMKNYQFKIATEEEAVAEISMHIKRLKRQKEEIDNMGKKISRDGQGKILSNRLVAIDDSSSAREYYGTFIK